MGSIGLRRLRNIKLDSLELNPCHSSLPLPQPPFRPHSAIPPPIESYLEMIQMLQVKLGSNYPMNDGR